MTEQKIDSITPKTRQAWRKWLESNHNRKESVWLVYHKKNSKNPTLLDWDDAVEEALCFGWIDSKRQSVDITTFRQLFAKRKPKGTWSRINKGRIERLTEQGLMAKAGFDAIENAKKNGSWTILDKVETLTIPPDLAKAFKKVKGSRKYFTEQPRSYKRAMLQWLVFAKRPETRKKRIDEIAQLSGNKIRKPL